MKRSRFTEEQIIGVFREHEAGAKTADLARKHGVSEATLYTWKAEYGADASGLVGEHGSDGDAQLHLAPAPDGASVRAAERRLVVARDRGGDGEPSGPALSLRRARAEALDLRRRQPRPRFPHLFRPVRGDVGGRKPRVPPQDGRRGAAD